MKVCRWMKFYLTLMWVSGCPGEEYTFVLSTLESLRSLLEMLDENAAAFAPSLSAGVALGVVNELYWKWVCLQRVREVAALSPKQRALQFARFEFYWAFYFISFACTNSARQHTIE